MNRAELASDYIKRWGSAQICASCGFVMSYGEFGKRQTCCGMKMAVVTEEKK